MVRVENTIDAIFQKKGFGIWPQDVIQPEQEDPLVTALNIEYRFQQHLALNKLDGLIALRNPDSKIEELIEECRSLLALPSELSPIAKFILLINVGHFKFLQNKISDSIDILKAANLEFGSNANNYVQSLFYRKHLLLANAYHHLQDASNEEQCLRTGVNFFNKIPTLSNIESTKWLLLIYDRIMQLVPTPRISQLEEFFQNKNYIISYVDYSIQKGIKYDSKELTAFVTSRSSSLLSSTKFPKSDEANNYELEEFLNQVNDCELINSQLSNDLLEKGINKTYQSHVLLRSLTQNLLSLGKKEESYHSFEVYLDYIERYYVQNNNSFKDILGILNTFRVFLNYRFLNKASSGNDISIEEYDRYLKILNKFKELLRAFYEDNDILEVDEEFDLLDENKLLLNVNNDSLRKFLSEIWYTLAISNIKLHKSSHSILTENESKLKESVKFFKNSIYNDFKNEEIFFQYIKFISTLRKIKESYGLLKYFLTKQTTKNTIFFKSWHLLALIVSIEENKDEAYKIVNFLVSEITDFLELTQGENLSFEIKSCFIQIKITQLAIVESLLGIEQSLDSLSELFSLFNQLFKDSLPETVENKPPQTANLHRSSTLTKIKSIRSHKEVKPKHHQQQQQPTKHSRSKPLIDQDKLLQQIWLVTSTIYFKAGYLEDAAQAIDESEKAYQVTPETLTIRGLVTNIKTPEISLRQYEKALGLNRDYPLAIIGISNLFLAKENKNIYINEKDSNAAIARVKILLELLTGRFDTSMVSEVWFLLSKIYEKYGDKKRYRNSLWRSIELEETRPIRDFNYI